MTNTHLYEDAAATADLMRIDRRFGTVLREGRWLVPAQIEVRLAMGDVRLDFTEAVVNADTVRLNVDLGLGADLTLVVRPGIEVVTTDLDARYGDLRVQTPFDRNTPVVLRLEVSGRLHFGGDLVIRAPKRNLDQWMRPGSAT